jgi:hypothetical protein
MKFQDKFKPGDIICSDHFRGGLCMIVESSGVSFTKDEFRYRCQDLVKENQNWIAYEFLGDSSYSTKPHNWRIATEDDIAKYLSRFIDIPLGKVGQFYLAKLIDDGIMLEDLMFPDRNVYLGIEELADLKRIIDEKVG